MEKNRSKQPKNILIFSFMRSIHIVFILTFTMAHILIYIVYQTQHIHINIIDWIPSIKSSISMIYSSHRLLLLLLLLLLVISFNGKNIPFQLLEIGLGLSLAGTYTFTNWLLLPGECTQSNTD